MATKRHRRISVSFILAIITAILLIASILSQQFITDIPKNTIVVLLSAFVILKIWEIIKAKGSIFEDYASLALIIIFGFLNFFVLKGNLNTAISVVIVFTILYSVGLIPTVTRISRSKNVASFIISYIIFIIAVMFLFAGAYSTNNTGFTSQGNPIELSFANALYFSTITFTTVGYGDIEPVGINRVIASTEAISGIVLNIAFIGYVLSSRRFFIEKPK